MKIQKYTNSKSQNMTFQNAKLNKVKNILSFNMLSKLKHKKTHINMFTNSLYIQNFRNFIKKF